MHRLYKLSSVMIASYGLTSISNNYLQAQPSSSEVNISKQRFGTWRNSEVDLYTLSNSQGMSVQITSYGCTITSIKVPDARNNLGEVVLGFDDFDSYISEEYNSSFPHMGGMVGRYGNRIKQGKFRIDGEEYILAVNNGPNHLHGGIIGFDRVIWTGKVIEGKGVQFKYLSRDGEEGYPGNLDCTVSYLLTDDNQLIQQIYAVSDKPTVLNLTNHSYFNLAHGLVENALDHEVLIPADSYVEVDETSIPTGNLPSTHGNCMDFNSMHPIQDRIHEVTGLGYDHTYILRDEGTELKLAAHVKEPVTGREMKIFTSEPGVQFYTGNYLNNIVGHSSQIYPRHYGFCLETQKFPDSPNQPEFPCCILRPGETFSSITILQFLKSNSN
jgi:aldose 1-epimerase